MIETNSLPYRPCVGLMVLNSDSLVFTGQRIDLPTAWQMPQGGIEKNENIEEAAYRELYEETSIEKNSVAIIKISENWIKYELPESLVPILWNGRYRGQIQKWLLLRYSGSDNEINVQTKDPEFLNWRWSNQKQLISSIVSFKKRTYKKLLDEFSYYLG